MVLQNHTKIVDTNTVTKMPTANNDSVGFYKENRNIIQIMRNIAYFN